ncbi:hypothetical protein, partial [Streptomyces sp. SPB78]|uniref:hypothetical protein n=1 Tax=Streptomyces sp. (strain SPB78) TaxID=591157 RepID=UPI0001B57EFC
MTPLTGTPERRARRYGTYETNARGPYETNGARGARESRYGNQYEAPHEPDQHAGVLLLAAGGDGERGWPETEQPGEGQARDRAELSPRRLPEPVFSVPFACEEAQLRMAA